MKKIDDFWKPFISSTDESTENIIVQNNITTVVDNLGDFYTSVSKGNNIKRSRFLIQEYNLGDNGLESYRMKGGANIIKTKLLTKPDEANVKSFLTLPESTFLFSRVSCIF